MPNDVTTSTPPLARALKRTMSTSASNKVILKHIDWDSINKTKFYTIGPALFLGVRLITYPPALIKTRLQVQQFRTTPKNTVATLKPSSTPTPTPSTKSPFSISKVAHVRTGQYNNTLDAFRTIIKTDGPLALWQGFLPKTLGLIGGNVYISCYELFRSKMLKNQYGQLVSDIIAGGAASLISQVIIVPIDLITQRMAVDLDGRSLSLHFQDVWKEAGIRGLYRGYLPSIMTYLPVSSIWWSTYGWTKPIVANPMHNFVQQKCNGSLWTTERCTESLCGFISGATAGILTNPMDVIKVRRQLSGYGNGETTLGVVKELYQMEGYMGFTRGAGARVLNMSSSGALIVTVYECIKRLSRKDAIEKEE